MRKPLTVKQLSTAIEARAAKVRATLEALSTDKNPQVVDIYIRSRSELEALESVLDAIKQRTTYFLEH